MALLIDGYNLLHVTGIFGKGTDSTALHRSRTALLRFLAASLDPAERPHTTIVFDAAGASPGLPPTLDHEQITVHFARDYPDADEMLEDLIAAHQSPRTLIVVSSDHRVQRAARRRKAKAVDSDRWYADLLAERRQRGAPQQTLPQKPTGDLTSAEVDYWLNQFEQKTSTDTSRARQDKKKSSDLDNPFPPGYAEDITDEELT
jgi:uncharacterized protein